jgi:nitrite reductase (NADH) large subunit
MTGLQDCKSREKLVVVGAGMAATRFVEELTRPPIDTTFFDRRRTAACHNACCCLRCWRGLSVDDIELKPRQWWRAPALRF